ncbi:hypothetical protein J2W30_004491 [Variovorax boronicumulans]|uniref:hypothetical protein n=1 Tax=Variovorax boronicumulans TaxID=436515 RepID=UPI00277FDC5A|nr:hypothetical protein [Variovorax boronicumulans]MDQ0036716.1 hypothetical protein [Variovorax boronicumulans]
MAEFVELSVEERLEALVQAAAYGVIQRFPEDVDLTCDIRAIAADLIGDAVCHSRPARARKKKRRKEMRTSGPRTLLEGFQFGLRGLAARGRAGPKGLPIFWYGATVFAGT